MKEIIIRSSDKNEKIIFTLSDLDEKIMKDMVSSIDEWLTSGPLKLKIKNHISRIKERMRDKLNKKGIPLPSSEDKLVDMYFSDPNYKNRSDRDKESQIENLKRIERKS